MIKTTTYVSSQRLSMICCTSDTDTEEHSLFKETRKEKGRECVLHERSKYKFRNYKRIG